MDTKTAIAISKKLGITVEALGAGLEQLTIVELSKLIAACTVEIEVKAQ